MENKHRLTLVIKIAFFRQIKKARTRFLNADGSQGMFAIIRSRLFCPPVCYPKI